MSEALAAAGAFAAPGPAMGEPDKREIDLIALMCLPLPCSFNTDFFFFFLFLSELEANVLS